jgi:hypothetical protein
MMAGQADRGSTGQTGPTARRPAAGRPRRTAGRAGRIPIPVEIDAAAQRVISERAAVPDAEAIPPDILPRELQTQAAYRLLITSGFNGQDAAGLIGYVVGLAPGNSRWSLAQVNRLLFLRALYSDSDWGEAERRPA